MTRGRLLRLAAAMLVFLGASTLRCAAAGWSSMLLLPTRDLVVVGSAGGDVNAFDVKSGTVVWRRSAEAAAAVRLDLRGDEVLLLQQRGLRLAKVAKRDPQLVMEAIDGTTGTTRWTYITRGTLDGQPVVREDHMFLSLQTVDAPSGHVVAIDLKGGAEIWRVDMPALRLRAEGDDLFVLTSTPQGLVLTSLEGASGKPRWASPALKGDYKSGPDLVSGTAVISTRTAEPATLHYAGVYQGRQAWALDFPDQAFDEVRLEGPFLTARTDQGRALAVYDAVSGQSRWKVSPAAAAAPKGELLATTVDGQAVYTVAAVPPDRLTVLGLAAADGREVAHADLQGRLEAPLTVLGDKLLTGVQTPSGDHQLVCLSSRELKPLWTLPLEAALGESTIKDVAGPDGPMLLLQTENRAIGLDPRSGQQRFSVEVDVATGPVIHGPLLVFGDNNLNLVVLDMGAPEHARARINTKVWFNLERLPNLLFVFIIVGLILTYIARARRDSNLFIRRLAGLNALDEAVGRATEMGKPVLYVCGTQDVDEIETLAGLSILGHVARRAAEYETPLLVPTSRSVVMSTAQEVVREAHYKAGRPDSYVQDNIRYLTDDQFGFVAGVDGIMVREKPAANFYMGMFFGESLILAETGHSTGAIQIAGTAQAAQLPFFVAACDYTLMGEELFAASAYLSRDPREVGSVKGQDYAKLIIMLVILLASITYKWFPEVKTWLSQ